MDNINGTKFTNRELDILACIIHNRGDKKIAALLDISPRTVGSHVRNIMLKSSANSKDAIRDFIESAGAISYISELYSEILLNSCFRKYLALVKRQIITSPIEKEVIFPNNFDQKLIDRIISDCKIAGIALLPSINYSSDELNPVMNDFAENEYFKSIFNVIYKISPQSKIKDLYQEFKTEHENLQEGSNPEYEAVTKNHAESNIKRNIIFGILVSLLIIMILSNNLYNDSRMQVRSNLIVPNDNVTVRRKSELKKIDKIFAEDKNKISILVLTGAAGSGKSALARQYAKSQNNPIIWEIDASNMDNMISSFERLASAMQYNANDDAKMDYISKIKEPSRKIKELGAFVSNKTRENPDWLLIYNSLNSFKHINQYFPHDHKKWGVGKVIITTNRSIISQADFIPENNILKLGELSHEEKVELFDKILGNQGVEKYSENKDQFIKDLLPYPLDIRNAANLIKDTKLPYAEYSKILANEPSELSKWEEEFQADTSSYEKTRYNLITASIDKILEENPEYKMLLLLVNSINSEDISIDLLQHLTSKVKARSLIKALKESSFIREKDSPEDVFSLHHSVQQMSRNYMLKSPKFRKKDNVLGPVAEHLNSYTKEKLEQENIDDIKNVAPHLKDFIKNFNHHTGEFPTDLVHNLGMAYFDLGSYKNSRKYLELSHKLYIKKYGKKNIKTAKVKSRLGILYRNLGFYEDSLKLLEESHIIYKTHYDRKYDANIGKILIYLGSAYRNLKQYDVALKYTTEGLEIYKKNYAKDSIEIAWAEAYLACILGHIGDPEQALGKLEFAQMQYSKYYKNAPIKRAWLSVRLGLILEDLGRYKEAEKHLKHALGEYKLHVSEDSIELAWNMAHLGILYNKTGNKILAKKYLSKAYSIYSKNIGTWPKEHQTINWVKENLAQA